MLLQYYNKYENRVNMYEQKCGNDAYKCENNDKKYVWKYDQSERSYRYDIDFHVIVHLQLAETFTRTLRLGLADSVSPTRGLGDSD